MHRDLNDFLGALDEARELARIPDRVSPDLEICAVTDRVSKSPGGGPARLAPLRRVLVSSCVGRHVPGA